LIRTGPATRATAAGRPGSPRRPPDKAERLTRTAYELAVTAGLPDALNVLVGQLGTIATARGTAAMETLVTDKQLAVAPAPPLLLQAYGLVTAGRREEARALFRAGLSGADRFPGPSRWLFLWVVAELAHQLGDADAARSIHGELLRYADRFVVAEVGVKCKVILGCLASHAVTSVWLCVEALSTTTCSSRRGQARATCLRNTRNSS
jgi:hypothetical protein